MPAVGGTMDRALRLAFVTVLIAAATVVGSAILMLVFVHAVAD